MRSFPEQNQETGTDQPVGPIPIARPQRLPTGWQPAAAVKCHNGREGALALGFQQGRLQRHAAAPGKTHPFLRLGEGRDEDGRQRCQAKRGE